MFGVKSVREVKKKRAWKKEGFTWRDKLTQVCRMGLRTFLKDN